MGISLRSILARTIKQIGVRGDGMVVVRDTKLAILFMVSPSGKILDENGEPFNEWK